MAEWRDVPGFGGTYQVSDLGGVRKTRGVRKGPMTPTVKRPRVGSSYRKVRLLGADGRRREFKVARLVAQAFIGPIGDHAVVHRDGNVLDDAADNLALLDKAHLGIDYGARSRSRAVAKASPGAEIVAVYRSAREAARENFMSYQTVIDRCNGRARSFLAPDGFRYIWDDSPEAAALYGLWEYDGYVESEEAERLLSAYPDIR